MLLSFVKWVPKYRLFLKNTRQNISLSEIDETSPAKMQFTLLYSECASGCCQKHIYCYM